MTNMSRSPAIKGRIGGRLLDILERRCGRLDKNFLVFRQYILTQIHIRMTPEEKESTTAELVLSAYRRSWMLKSLFAGLQIKDDLWTCDLRKWPASKLDQYAKEHIDMALKQFRSTTTQQD